MVSRLVKTLIAVAAVAAVGAGTAAAWPSGKRPPPVAMAAVPTAAGLEPGALARGPGAVVLGNPQGDVTVIEYFDYQCPACRRAHPYLEKLVAEDRNVRVVHKHWPVFGAVSVYAARIAFAARWQGRYEQVHDAIFAISGRMNEEKVRRAAVGAGLDLARAERELRERGAEVDAALGETAAQAAMLQLRGTPRFVVGGYLTQGSLDLKAMREIVRQVRSGAKQG